MTSLNTALHSRNSGGAVSTTAQGRENRCRIHWNLAQKTPKFGNFGYDLSGETFGEPTLTRIKTPG